MQLSALPDKGARLKENIQQLESKIQNLDLNKDASRTSQSKFFFQILSNHAAHSDLHSFLFLLFV